MIRITHSSNSFFCTVPLPGSKSESNRALIIRALNPEVRINNLSEADDTVVLQKLLGSVDEVLDAGPAGTTFRFLTAYFSACTGRDVFLTGSERMQERPVAVLVDALRNLNADITYCGKEGYPPLRIRGKKLKGGTVAVNATVSSQFITALMLIAPYLYGGLVINLSGTPASLPYLKMTAQMQQLAGALVSLLPSQIVIKEKEYQKTVLRIEADWSSASYWFSIAALAPFGSHILLQGLSQNSLQGDSLVKEIYKQFGVSSHWESEGLLLEKSLDPGRSFTYDFSDVPDLAQTVAVTMAAKGVTGTLTGLKTLKVKETDRIVALQKELRKLGALCNVTDESLEIIGFAQPQKDPEIETYHDHRMALAFAPYSLIAPLKIKNPAVVSKSYPFYWKDLSAAGFSITEIS